MHQGEYEEEIMKPYAEMSKEELVALRRDLKAKYHDFQTKDLRSFWRI